MSLINIKGGKALQDMLNTLPIKLEKNIMRGALLRGAKVILAEAKQNIPVKSGALRDSIRVSTGYKKGRVTAKVKVGSKKVFYSSWVEYGTAAHDISGKGKGFLNFGGIFAKSVHHPGIKPKAFLRPALDSKANQAIIEVGDYIRKRLTKEGLNAPAALEVGNE